MIINIDLDTLICAISSLEHSRSFALAGDNSPLAHRMATAAQVLRNALGIAEEFGATERQEAGHG